ncbi:MAG TPA: tetratricopeptide repeat protein [Candidatus Omnitrophota bacterium]|nr:tetratricopeptide repeat protein [Candidatus Omnitrophota bacterium]HOX09707.1 tetratricopeptide repeat protein [Candidatus Omnitrophota bacterium]
MTGAGKIRNYLITAAFIAAVFIGLRPQVSYLLYRRAGDYMSATMVKDAARTYRKALFFNAKDVDSRNWLAYCYDILGEREKAVAEYKIAIKYDPDNVTAYFDLGDIKRTEGDIASAKEYFNKVLDCKKSPNITDGNYKFYMRSARHMLRIIKEKYGDLAR